jgi:hypothetical protein
MKKQYKILISLIILMVILPMVSSSDLSGLPSQKQGETIFIIQSCDNSTYSNISSILVGSSVINGVTVMPEISNDYYVYNLTNSQTLGTYIVNGYCDENGVKTNWAYDFPVTKTETPLTQAETNISTNTIYFLLFLGALFIIVGLLLLGKSFWVTWLGIFFMAIGFIFLYYDLVLVNLYINTINITGQATEGIFLIFARFIKILPYVTALIVGFAIVKMLRGATSKKKSEDGWDDNKY